jgi:hypothetical protein
MLGQIWRIMGEINFHFPDSLIIFTVSYATSLTTARADQQADGSFVNFNTGSVQCYRSDFSLFDCTSHFIQARA